MGLWREFRIGIISAWFCGKFPLSPILAWICIRNIIQGAHQVWVCGGSSQLAAFQPGSLRERSPCDGILAMGLWEEVLQAPFQNACVRETCPQRVYWVWLCRSSSMYALFQTGCIRETSHTEHSGYGFVEGSPSQAPFQPRSVRETSSRYCGGHVFVRVLHRHHFSLDV